MASTLDVSDATPDDPVRAFTDSSMLFTAAISGSGPALSVFQVARRGRLVLFASPYVVDETERNLYHKNRRGLHAFRDLRDLLHLVDPVQNLIDEVAQAIEAKDAAIVAGAIAAQAHYLMTYDRRHLLSQAELIRRLYQIETVPPGTALRQMGEGQ
jgi:predicted nucleic acid-binding protein